MVFTMGTVRLSSAGVQLVLACSQTMCRLVPSVSVFQVKQDQLLISAASARKLCLEDKEKRKKSENTHRLDQ